MAQESKASDDEIQVEEARAEVKHADTESVRARARASHMLQPEQLDDREAAKGATRRKGGPSLDEERDEDPSALYVEPTECEESEE